MCRSCRLYWRGNRPDQLDLNVRDKGLLDRARLDLASSSSEVRKLARRGLMTTR